MPQRGGMSIDIDNFMHTFLLIWCGYTGRTQAEAASSLLLLILEKKQTMSQPDKKTLIETNIEEAYNRHLAIASTVKEQYDKALMEICADMR